MFMTSRRLESVSCLSGLALVILCGAASGAAAQQPTVIVRDTAVVAKALQQVRGVLPVVERTAVARRLATGWYAGGPQNVPQDVRIMQTIVRTALSQVKAPEVPSDTAAGAADTALAYVVAPRSGLFGRGSVSGFYMKGYGYLFTVSWPVRSTFTVVEADGRLLRFAEADAQREAKLAQAEMKRAQAELAQQKAQQEKLTAQAQAEARKMGEADAQAVRERVARMRLGQLRRSRARSMALDRWAAQYRQRLTDALRDAIAGYASTLRRARPGESITFIADFGGGDSARVTMTVKAGALHGSDLQVNRRAIQVSTGQEGMPERLRTQLKIMSGIIDTSLRPDASGGPVLADTWSTYFGGSAETQYVPGYGVIFRKNARLNTVRAFAGFSGLWRRQTGDAAVDSTERAARDAYEQHLDTLRHETAKILATYGPTLTDLPDGDWVGIYYDVGSVAALVDAGTEDYLVQARMSDVRQASSQSDPAAWLERRLVTNQAGS